MSKKRDLSDKRLQLDAVSYNPKSGILVASSSDYRGRITIQPTPISVETGLIYFASLGGSKYAISLEETAPKPLNLVSSPIEMFSNNVLELLAPLRFQDYGYNFRRDDHGMFVASGEIWTLRGFYHDAEVLPYELSSSGEVFAVNGEIYDIRKDWIDSDNAHNARNMFRIEINELSPSKLAVTLGKPRKEILDMILEDVSRGRLVPSGAGFILSEREKMLLGKKDY